MKTRTISPAIFLVGLIALNGLVLLTSCKSAPEPTHDSVAPKAAVKAAPTKVAATNTEAVLEQAAAKPTVPLEGTGWKPLLDGKTLAGWKVGDFGGSGPVECESGLVVIETGDALSGITYTNGDVPKVNYEVALDAMKLQGGDFFCGLTFPVADSYCTLIVGGWGGTVVGLSSLDEQDASENESTSFMRFEYNRWYHVRLRVTDKKIEAWLDGKQIANVKTAEHKIDLRFGEIENSKPLGITTYQTRAAIREVKLRVTNGE